MKLSNITGIFTSSDREFIREYEGEKFYIYNFSVEAGLDISVRVSEYIEVPVGIPVSITGYLSSCNRFNETKGRKAMFTFFNAKLITPLGDNYEPSKRIECSGVVTHIYTMGLTKGGTEKLTLVVKEHQSKSHVGIIHYTAMGKLARQLSSQLKVGDTVEGCGILRKKIESLEVLLLELVKEVN